VLVAHDYQGQRTEGRTADKAQSYFCPICHAPLTLKQGQIKIWHFAHKSATDCPGSKESAQHLILKDYLYRLFKQQSTVKRCELEYPLCGRVADIWLSNGRQQIAVECQVSAMTLDALGEKLDHYDRCGIYSLYVIYSKRLADETEQDSQISIPAWIRALHALYLGRVYTFTNPGFIYPTHFDTIRRYNEAAYNSDGDEVGGFSYSLKSIKCVSFGPALKDERLILKNVQCKSRLLPGRFKVALFSDKMFW
jgi:hypothetical protein